MITVPFATHRLHNHNWLLCCVGLDPVLAVGHSWLRDFNGLIIVRTLAATATSMAAFIDRLSRGHSGHRRGFDVCRDGVNYGLFTGYLSSWDLQSSIGDMQCLHRVTFTGTYDACQCQPRAAFGA
jgi:hypothetical protein